MAETSTQSGQTPGSTMGVGEGAQMGQGMLTFDMTEKALIKAMEAITSEEILAFTSLLEVTQTQDIDITLYSIFDFQGFDPRAIARKFLVINKHFRDTIGKTEETLDQLKNDVMFCIAANIYMGNLQSKSLSRRSASGRQKVSYLVAKYSMKIASTGAGQPSDVITFPRVTNSFPVLACRMASVLPSKNFLAAPFNTVTLPKFMRISAFGSFCDISLPERTSLFLLQAVCAYSCDQSITVHEGEKKKRKIKKTEDVMTPLDAYALQWDFITVTATSPVPILRMRKGMMLEFKVDSLYSILEPIVKNFRTLIGDQNPIVAKEDFEKDIRDFTSST